MEVRSVQVRKGTVTIGIEGEAAADDGSMARKGVSSSLVAGLDWAGMDMQAKPRQGKARQGKVRQGEVSRAQVTEEGLQSNGGRVCGNC